MKLCLLLAGALLAGALCATSLVRAAEPTLKAYHLLPALRGDLLDRLGRKGDARAEFERAAALTRNERERKVLLDRAADCANA